MSRRKQTTPNKVHCEYLVTQHRGVLVLAGLLWSEVGRRGGVWGEWWLLTFHLRDCKKTNRSLCIGGGGRVLAWQDRDRLEETPGAVKAGVRVQGL